jgi:hypothetical protein
MNADNSVCPQCASATTEALVEQGSYVLRCAHCGTAVVATSFLAFRQSTQLVAAYRDPGYGQMPQPAALIATGTLADVHSVVSAVASRGTPVLLVGQR